jgi:hypothetical protein
MYASATPAVVEKHQKSLIDSFEVVVETLQRSYPLSREEFHLIEDRFKNNEQFVRNLSEHLGITDVLIPGPPKEGSSYRRDQFLSEVKQGNVSEATQDIISWLNIMNSLNGILLAEASLDSSREKELRDLYDTQWRDLLILSQEFNAWVGAITYDR